MQTTKCDSLKGQEYLLNRSLYREQDCEPNSIDHGKLLHRVAKGGVHWRNRALNVWDHPPDLSGATFRRNWPTHPRSRAATWPVPIGKHQWFNVERSLMGTSKNRGDGRLRNAVPSLPRFEAWTMIAVTCRDGEARLCFV